MKVILTSAARSNLRRIGRYLKAENPRIARAVVDDLYEKALEIGDFSKRYPVVVSDAETKLRRRVVGQYLIFYSVEDDRVIVTNVFHGARDLDVLLRDED